MFSSVGKRVIKKNISYKLNACRTMRTKERTKRELKGREENKIKRRENSGVEKVRKRDHKERRRKKYKA